MKVTEYIKDKVLILIGNATCMLLLAGFLYAIRVSALNIGIILVVWCAILLFFFGIEYHKIKSYFTEIETTMEGLDKRYLIGEVMPKSHRLIDKKYHDIICKSNKSVIEKIHQLEDEQRDYREYIESWIHEVKVPITAMSLHYQGSKGESQKEMQIELAKIDNYVEMALFYARSDEVYKDYLIRETNLERIVEEVIARNKQYFIQNHMTIELGCEGGNVFTDEKWIAFILNQIVINAVKYKDGERGYLHIYNESVSGGLRLVIEDRGLGIPESEKQRIFDKGFTGSNGRDNEKATGMGLYLCKKLCDKLGITLSVESEEGVYTKMILAFPISRYLSKL